MLLWVLIYGRVLKVLMLREMAKFFSENWLVKWLLDKKTPAGEMIHDVAKSD